MTEHADPDTDYGLGPRAERRSRGGLAVLRLRKISNNRKSL